MPGPRTPRNRGSSNGEVSVRIDRQPREISVFMITMLFRMTFVALLVTGLLTIAGCPEEPVRRSSAPREVQVCHEESKAITSKEIVFACENRSDAQVTVTVCDLIAASARELVQTNR